MKVLNVSVTYWKKIYKLKHFIKCKIMVLSLVSAVLSSKLKTIFSWASKNGLVGRMLVAKSEDLGLIPGA